MDHLNLPCANVLAQVAGYLDQSFDSSSSSQTSKNQVIGVNAYLNILHELSKYSLLTSNSVLRVLDVVVSSKNPNLTKLLQLFGHLNTAIAKEKSIKPTSASIENAGDTIVGNHLRRTCLMAVTIVYPDSPRPRQAEHRVRRKCDSSQINCPSLCQVFRCMLFRD